MSPAEFAARLRELEKTLEADPEALHMQADGVMLDLLRSLGYGEGVEIFEQLHIWYS